MVSTDIICFDDVINFKLRCLVELGCLSWQLLSLSA